MKSYIFALLALSFTLAFGQNKKGKNFYELKVYEYKTLQQEAVIDQFLSDAFIPYLHRKGIKHVGAFTGRANDTSAIKKLYVLIPYKSMDEIPKINTALFSDQEVATKGAAYLDASPDAAPYARIVTYIIEGFRFSPTLTLPKLSSSFEDKVYELRSYEGPTEKRYRKKVEMFNEGGEIDLFARLNFNAIFYGEVVSGPTMPNLMYMTSFENKDDRDAHWKSFSNDPQWKELSSRKEYEKTVSKNVTLFLKARPYSDY
ncbi:MAG: hypothetical protein RL634_1766 [Bacteroidota bacterium]|jgi:hypothetical protein